MSQTNVSAHINTQIENAYKNDVARLRAILLRLLGAHNLPSVEDILQDTFAKAVVHWQVNGLPKKPSAWLILSAKRAALDIIRSRKVREKLAQEITQNNSGSLHATSSLISGWSSVINGQFENAQPIDDEQLRLLAWLCSSKLHAKYLFPAVLKLVCGLSSQAISKAMLISEANTKKRITRATEALKEHAFTEDFSSVSDEAKAHIHHILYLLFNEGINHQAEEPSAIPLACIEALNLVQTLLKNAELRTMQSKALLMLMHLYMTRLSARVDESGRLIPLTKQNRSAWRTPYLVQGSYLLNQILDDASYVPCAYFYEAIIAHEHLRANTFEETHWERVVGHYQSWLKLFENPIVQAPMVLLNMAVAQAQFGKLELALAGLDTLRVNHKFNSGFQLAATFAYVHGLDKNSALSSQYYAEAKHKGMGEKELAVLSNQIHQFQNS